MSRKFLTPIVLPADPAVAMEAATKQYVDNRPAGDEVWIGTSDPGAAYELWYDTDEPNLYEPDTARWNTAWGIVGKATMLGLSGTTIGAGAPTDICSPLTVSLVAGRRYRLAGRVRAVNPVGAAGNGFMRISGPGIGSNDIYTVISGTFDSLRSDLLLEPSTSGPATFYCGIQTSVGAVIYAEQQVSFFIVEDVGPVSLSSNPPAQPASVWTNLTFENGWSDFGGGYRAAQYRKVGDQVYLRGLIKHAAAITPITDSQAFTLPVGFRPLWAEIFAVNTAGSTGWGDGTGRVSINNLGQTTVTVASTAQAATSYTSLSGVQFSMVD